MWYVNDLEILTDNKVLNNSCFILTMWYVNALWKLFNFLLNMFYINYVVCKFAMLNSLSIARFILTMWYVNKIK